MNSVYQIRKGSIDGYSAISLILFFALLSACSQTKTILPSAHGNTYETRKNIPFSNGAIRVMGYTEDGSISYIGQLRDSIHVGTWRSYRNSALISKTKYDKTGNVKLIARYNVPFDTLPEQ